MLPQDSKTHLAFASGKQKMIKLNRVMDHATPKPQSRELIKEQSGTKQQMKTVDGRDRNKFRRA